MGTLVATKLWLEFFELANGDCAERRSSIHQSYNAVERSLIDFLPNNTKMVFKAALFDCALKDQVSTVPVPFIELAAQFRHVLVHWTTFRPTQGMAVFCVLVWSEVWSQLYETVNPLPGASSLFDRTDEFSIEEWRMLIPGYVGLIGCPTPDEFRSMPRYRQLLCLAKMAIDENTLCFDAITPTTQWLRAFLYQLKYSIHNGDPNHHTPLVPRQWNGETLAPAVHKHWTEESAALLSDDIKRIGNKAGIKI